MKPQGRKRFAGAHASVFAKIAGPAVASVYNRVRLFRVLDRARKAPIVWISAPGGAGKTTLVSSYLQARRLPVLWYKIDTGDNDVASFFYYMGLAAKKVAPRHRHTLPLLTREYRAGLPTFTANYFRDLFSRLQNPSVVVFDNYQEADPEGSLQEIFQGGLDQIPPGINVIFLSRQGPPSAFARLSASKCIAPVAWEELKLTEQESHAIVRLRHKRTMPSRETIARLHQETQGWVAGLVLLAEGGASGQARPTESANQSIFDYFANEIFRRTSLSTQQFLLTTSFLPKISVSVAQALAEEKNSEAILGDFTKRNYFTVKHVDGSYEYHPLFRAFLVNRAAEIWSASQVNDLKRRAAQLLAESGDVETAVPLLQQAEDWRGVECLSLKHAGALLAQGRMQTLESWLRSVPEFQRERNPWLLYWLGNCRLPFAPGEARGYFKEAFVLFEMQNDASPLYLTWSKIIDSFILEFNDFTPMIEWLDRYTTLKNGRLPPATRIENASIFTYISGLATACFDHPDLPHYVKRAEGLLRDETDLDRRLFREAALFPYYLWRDDIVKVGNLLDQLSPLIGRASGNRSVVRLHWYVCKAMHAGIVGDTDESLQAVNDGLAFAEASGIHLLDNHLLCYGIWGQLKVENVAAARALAERMTASMGHGKAREALYLHHVSTVTLHEGNLVRAIEEGRRATELAKGSGYFVGTVGCLVALAACYLRQGNTNFALSALAEARPMAVAMRGTYFMAACDFCESIARRLRGEHARSLKMLESGLLLARNMGMLRLFAWCSREDAAAFCAMALEANIQPDYVRGIIARMRLSPPNGMMPENWPWPIRIYTLGRFAVMKQDDPHIFVDGNHRKPMELLRVLIALGGKDVAVAKITQILWPDSDGDAAKIALETTLHRLRRVLGERSVLMQHRQLSLDPTHCWLDVWEFERLLDKAEETSLTFEQTKRFFNLYQGSFLTNDDLPEVALLRVRLQTKFLRLILREGKTLEAGGKHEEALHWYQKGIEVDPLADELYLRLMHCYRDSNRPVEALATYRRCETALRSMLQVEPTSEMKALQTEIRRSLS